MVHRRKTEQSLQFLSHHHSRGSVLLRRKKITHRFCLLIALTIHTYLIVLTTTTYKVERVQQRQWRISVTRRSEIKYKRNTFSKEKICWLFVSLDVSKISILNQHNLILCMSVHKILYEDVYTVMLTEMQCTTCRLYKARKELVFQLFFLACRDHNAVVARFECSIYYQYHKLLTNRSGRSY